MSLPPPVPARPQTPPSTVTAVPSHLGHPPTPTPPEFAVVVSPGDSIAAAIARLIDAPGSRVLLTAGDHRLTSSVHITTEVHITGAPGASVTAVGCTAFVLTAPRATLHSLAIGVTVPPSPAVPVDLRATGACRGRYTADEIAQWKGRHPFAAVAVRAGAPALIGLRITSQTRAGVEITTGGDPAVVDCTFVNCAWAAALIHKFGKGRFSGCELTGSRLAGIAIQSNGDPDVTRCIITGSASAGVLIEDAGLGRITDCHVSSSALVGIVVGRAANPVISGNRVFGGADAGILVCAGGKGKIVDNEIYDNARAGIEVTGAGAQPHLIKGNVIRDGRDAGILVAGGAGGFRVENNTIAGNAKSGVEMRDGAAAEVVANTIKDNAGSGVLCYASAAGHVISNRIHANAGDGVAIGANSSPAISGNHIFNNGRHGVMGRGLRGQNFVSGNGRSDYSDP